MATKKSKRRSRKSRSSRRRFGNASTTHRFLSGRGPYYANDTELDVLLDVAKPHWTQQSGHVPKHPRKLPHHGDSVVYDRAYKQLSNDGFIRWVQVDPRHSSLSMDHYALTDKGHQAVRTWKVWDAQPLRFGSSARDGHIGASAPGARMDRSR